MKFSDKLIELVDEYDLDGPHLPYGFAVEHINEKGQMDFAHFIRKYKVYGSVKDFCSAVELVFGTLQFTYDVPTDTVTKEEFLEIYEFGKFPRVMDWIPYVAAEKGKLILREDLFAWVLSTSAPSKANYSMGDINNVE